MGLLGDLIQNHIDEQRKKEDAARELAIKSIAGIHGNLGQLDPNAPDYDAQQQQYQYQLKAAEDQLNKVMPKEGKGLMQQFGQIMQHFHKQRAAGAAGGAAGGGGTGQQPQSAMSAPAPPQTSEPSPLVPGLKVAQPGEPASFGSMVNAAAPDPVAAAAALARGSLDATMNNRTAGAKAANLTPGTPDFQEYMATGKFPTIPRMVTGTYTSSDGKTFTGAPDPLTGKIIDVDTGEVVPGATKETAGMQAAPSVKSVDGVPTYISRDGKSVYPGSPDFTDADKSLLDAANDAYQKGEAAKQTRQQTYMDAYAKMRGKVYQYGVIDNDTGALTYVNADTINSSPEGKYSPAAQAQTQKNRVAIFDEIDYTTKQLDGAIDGLGNESFTPTQRAQVALVLSDKDPRSALQSFLGSDWAATLSEGQIRYITALASMQESAMSLRSIAGMGTGSDMLRGAIQKMLPGPGTPSKEYAKRQMDLFRGEVGQLKRSIPSNVSTLAAPAPPSTGGAGPKATTAPPKTWEELKRNSASPQ